MNPADITFKQLIRGEEFRKYYGGLRSRFNSRKLKHSLDFYCQDGCCYMTLSVSDDRYVFVMNVGEKGDVVVNVFDADNNEKIRAKDFFFTTTDEFFFSYPKIFNEFFPRRKDHA
ncbi:hypothetical protein GCM10010919_14450 [Alishewanella longhuensis]|uniref:Uncharacterized protein n=1 Tax=Alishewanella longhuensis TaxID=1091037 RepID=A0ABQ3KYD2_9ALTE|nr:hypothetical protein [Alishewanella longhuensis]GHG66608.1 hypothetical protein GCM10010919_14450 [Alishewanella longhuensis]